MSGIIFGVEVFFGFILGSALLWLLLVLVMGGYYALRAGVLAIARAIWRPRELSL